MKTFLIEDLPRRLADNDVLALVSDSLEEPVVVKRLPRNKRTSWLIKGLVARDTDLILVEGWEEEQEGDELLDAERRFSHWCKVAPPRPGARETRNLAARPPAFAFERPKDLSTKTEVRRNAVQPADAGEAKPAEDADMTEADKKKAADKAAKRDAVDEATG